MENKKYGVGMGWCGREWIPDCAKIHGLIKLEGTSKTESRQSLRPPKCVAE